MVCINIMVQIKGFHYKDVKVCFSFFLIEKENIILSSTYIWVVVHFPYYIYSSPYYLLSIFFCSNCNSGRTDSNFHSVLQEETCIDSCNNSQIQQLTNVEAFKPIMEQDFSLDQQNLNSITSSTGLSCGFPIGSDGNSYGYPSNSTLIQNLLYDPDSQPQPQNSLYTNPSMLQPTWSKVSSMPKQQLSGLHFSNNTPFWNASAESLNDIRAGVLTSPQAQYQSTNFQEKKHSSPNPLSNKVTIGFQVSL